MQKSVLASLLFASTSLAQVYLCGSGAELDTPATPNCQTNDAAALGLQDNGSDFYAASFEVRSIAAGCKVVISSPPAASIPGCGVPVAELSKPGCVDLNVPSTFYTAMECS